MDFRNSQFANIRDEGADWPQRLRLSGLSYGELVPPLSAAVRVRGCAATWTVDPGNYETLAAMYRAPATTPAPVGCCWPGNANVGPTFPGTGGPGPGCRRSPSATGTGRCGPPSGCLRSSRPARWPSACTIRHRWPGLPHPAFNPLIYTLDLVLPLVDLGQRSAYDPQGAQRWLAYLLIAVGWIFATTIASGIARVLRRQ